jgi:hypothetical protein
MKGFLQSTVGLGLAGLVLAAVSRGDFDGLGPRMGEWLRVPGSYSEMAGKALEFDRKIMEADGVVRQLDATRVNVLEDRDQDSRLARDLMALLNDPHGPVTPAQIREAVLALESARAGDARRLCDLDRRIREAVQRKLALLQEKKDLFDDQHRAITRQYLQELIAVSKAAAGR